MKVNFKQNFWGIGQGLFYTANINVNDNNFIFLYDCGVEGKKYKKFLNEKINTFKTCYNINSSKNISLLIISHFHEDHVNGLDELLKGINEIGVIVIPYISCFEKSKLMLDYIKKHKNKNLDNDWYINFISDPLRYIENKVIIKNKVLLVGNNFTDCITDSSNISINSNSIFKLKFKNIKDNTNKKDKFEEISIYSQRDKKYLCELKTKGVKIFNHLNIDLYHKNINGECKIWYFKFFNYRQHLYNWKGEFKNLNINCDNKEKILKKWSNFVNYAQQITGTKIFTKYRTENNIYKICSILDFWNNYEDIIVWLQKELGDCDLNDWEINKSIYDEFCLFTGLKDFNNTSIVLYHKPNINCKQNIDSEFKGYKIRSYLDLRINDKELNNFISKYLFNNHFNGDNIISKKNNIEYILGKLLKIYKKYIKIYLFLDYVYKNKDMLKLLNSGDYDVYIKSGVEYFNIINKVIKIHSSLDQPYIKLLNTLKQLISIKNKIMLSYKKLLKYGKNTGQLEKIIIIINRFIDKNFENHKDINTCINNFNNEILTLSNCQNYKYMITTNLNIFKIIAFIKSVFTDLKVNTEFKGVILTGDINLNFNFSELYGFFKKEFKKTDIFLLPHHGSKKNLINYINSVELLTKNTIFLASAGLNSSFNHPSNETLLSILLNDGLVLWSNEFIDIETNFSIDIKGY